MWRALRRAACAKGLPVIRLHPAADWLVAPTRRVLHRVLRLHPCLPRAADEMVGSSCGGLRSKSRPEAHLGHAVCSTYYARSSTRWRRSRVPWECLGVVLLEKTRTLGKKYLEKGLKAAPRAQHLESSLDVRCVLNET